MTNKFTNFIRGDVRAVPEPQISKAEAARLDPPALSPEERAGFDAEARILRDRSRHRTD
jgi:hypothetical protein